MVVPNRRKVHGVESIIWTGTQFVATGMERVYTAVTGRDWSLEGYGTAVYMYGLAWTGKQLVAVGDSGIIFTSPDAVS